MSCASAGNCSAVGGYVDSGGNAQGLLLTETSGTWAEGVEAALPAGAATGGQQAVNIDSISCASPGNCSAVGQYVQNGPTYQGLLLTETSGQWGAGTQMTLPISGGAANPAVNLKSVSCPSAGNCVAVGYYTDGAGHQQGLIVTQTAGTWGTALEATPPTTTATNPFVHLGSVSCPSVGNCTAVGIYIDSSSHQQGLVVTEIAGVWRQGTEVTLPANAYASPQVGLGQVSCASVGNCTAAGGYQDTSGAVQGLLLSETAGTWSQATETTLPGGAGTNPQVILNALSCSSAGNCSAVGTYRDSAANLQGLLLTETAGNWATGTAAPLPAGAASNPQVHLNSVSCAAAGYCGAAGAYADGAGHLQGLLLTQTAGTWAAGIAAPLPADAATNPSATVNSIACSAMRVCAAVGGYSNVSGHGEGLLLGAAPAVPTLSVTAPASAIAGSTIAASSVAGVLASGASPIGTIAFTVFGPQSSPPSSCASGGTSVGSATVAGNGTYHPAAAFTPGSAGDYWWYASYGGDAGDTPAASSCGGAMAVTVVGARTGVGASLVLGQVKVVGKVVDVSVTCRSTATPCEVSVSMSELETLRGGKVIAVSASVGGHQHKRTIPVGRLTTTLQPGQSTVIHLRLNLAGRQLLSRFHHLAVKLEVVERGALVARKTVTFHMRPRR